MAKSSISRAVKLVGTETPDGKRRELRAGPLTAVLDNGALRKLTGHNDALLAEIQFPVVEEVRFKAKDGNEAHGLLTKPVGYEPGKPILTHMSQRFDPDDRIALLGKNGNGKSTLAKLLANKLPLMDGELVRARKWVPGYFAQHQLDELDGALTPIEALSHMRRALRMEQVRAQLGGFGFSSDKAMTKIADLSGGERARLMLALATLDKPNMLILDEPTNHLDIDARAELLNALNDFEGAVILVSHDRRLLEATADRFLLVADGRVEPFDGDLDDYRRYLLSGENTPSRREQSAKRGRAA